MCNMAAILDGASDRGQSGVATVHKVDGVARLARRVEILALLKAVCDGAEGGRAACE